MTRTVETLVVGAGPAGCAAAITLASAGREVLLVDRARFPRDKTCGDGLTTLALRELEALGLPVERVRSWQAVRTIWLHSPTARTITLELPADGLRSVIVPRLELDATLVDLARNSGAEVAEGIDVLSPRQSAVGFEAQTETFGTLRAGNVIAADGIYSPLRRHLGGETAPYRGDWHAFRQYFANVGEAAQAGVHVLFEPDLLPGFIWSFPLAGRRANVGFGVLLGGAHRVGDMGPLWRTLQQRPRFRALLGTDATADGPLRAWPIPARVGTVPLQLGAVRFVGDAAATTDPLTGEGIGQALLSGRLAAEAIVNGTEYERTLRRELARDHAMSLGLRRLITNPVLLSSLLRLVDANEWTRRNYARWLFEDYPRAQLLTPKRWRRGVLSRSGAFA